MNRSPARRRRVGFSSRRLRMRLATLALVGLAAACGTPSATPTPTSPAPASHANGSGPSASVAPTGSAGSAGLGGSAGGPAASAPWLDTSQSVETRVTALLGAMTLDEKIGQMTQIEVNSVDPAGVEGGLLGSVLSGGDGNPKGENTAENWYAMVNALQQGALQTRLRIPILYGVDATHGDAHLTGTTIFPQNVGMGATHDPAIVEQSCQVTAAEMNATGVRWSFAPVVAVPQDIRWGRTYEGYGEQTALVARLGTACLEGLQGASLGAPGTVVGDPKHYIGDGGTAYGSSTASGPSGPYLLDQGVDRLDDATIEKLFLPPYEQAVDAGARIVMVTFSSTQGGGKVTGDRHWITDVLKRRLGFTGFVVSDWGAIDQLNADYSAAVEQSINAGLDMAMVPQDWQKFESTLKGLVATGAVPRSRIDDAVTRILRVKFEMGLFENPMPPAGQPVGTPANRAVAATAVAESAVLLKTSTKVLPIAKTAKVLVSGVGADDIGIMAGGWTLSWQGQPGNVTAGTTLVAALKAKLGDVVQYAADGTFPRSKPKADVGVVVVAERPYAEGVGDSATLELPAADMALVAKMRPLAKKVVVVIISGRPMLLGAAASADAIVAAWLPGTEGEGLADVLLGSAPFTGTTPYTWPRTPADAPRIGKAACDGAVYPVGYGLDAKGKLLGPPAC